MQLPDPNLYGRLLLSAERQRPDGGTDVFLSFAAPAPTLPPPPPMRTVRDVAEERAVQ